MWPTLERAFACKFGVHRINGFELMVTADVIVMRVRIQDDDLQIGEIIDHASHITYPQPSVKKQRVILPRNKE